MFGLFSKDPVKKLEKNYRAKLEDALNAQRSGQIQRYASLTAEAEHLRRQIDQHRLTMSS